jgi:PKD domain/Secretion system C-terminal sorting domain/Right handed beta helix region
MQKKLLSKAIFTCLFFVAGCPFSFANKIYVSGNVEGVWETDTVVVKSNITVPYLKSLSIAKGTKVLFSGSYAIMIYGTITAIGEPSSLIEFNKYDTTASIGVWGGMLIQSVPTVPSIFKYCRFQNMSGSREINAEYGSVHFNYCTFTNNSGSHILYFWNPNVDVSHCVFAYNSANCIWMVGRGSDTFRLKQNTFFRNGGGVYADANTYTSVFEISDNIFWGNDQWNLHYVYVTDNYLYRSILNLRNCIIENGEALPQFNNTCSSKYPLFKDTVNFDFSPSWTNYPVSDSTKSPAIDAGYALDGLNEDSTRADIGAIPFYNPNGINQTSVRFSYDSTIGYRSSLTVHFTNLSHEGSSPAWYWDFGDGYTSTEKSPTHIFQTTGSFTVKLKSKDVNNFTDSLVYKDLVQIYPGTRVNAGDIYGVWEKRYSPYYIYGDVQVPVGKKLEIQPGVKVLFMDIYEMKVFGILSARGTSEDTINFDAYDTSNLHKLSFADDYNLSSIGPITQLGGWYGIHITKTPEATDTTYLEYCRIANTRNGNYNDANYQRGAVAFRNTKNVFINHCLFYNNLYGDNGEIMDTSNYAHSGGIVAIRSNIKANYNRFYNLYSNRYSVMQANFCDSIFFAHNEVVNCRDELIRMSNVLNFYIDSNIFADNHGRVVHAIKIWADDSLHRNRSSFSNVSGNLFIRNSSLNNTCIDAGNQTKILINNNKFIDNYAAQWDPCIVIWGDALFINNNLFYHNGTSKQVGNESGTIDFFLDGTLTGVVANNTMIANYASVNYQAAGIYGDDHVKLYNNIIRNSTTPELSAVKFTTSYQSSTFSTALNNNVKGGYSGSGNFDSDPKFVDSINLRFALKSGSQCINKGIEISGIHLPTTDLEGLPRIDTFLNKIDVGAYEYFNHKPMDILLDRDSILEQLPVNSYIGKFSTIDPDSLDHFTYAFVDSGTQNYNQQFSLTNDLLYSNAVFNYQALNIVPISIKTDDGYGGVIKKNFNILIKQNAVTAIVEVGNTPAGIKIISNPFHDQLRIVNSNVLKVTLQLFSGDGKLINESQLKKGTDSMNTSNFPSGIYYLLFNVDNKLYSVKAIKI